MSNSQAEMAEARELARMFVQIAERARAAFASAVAPLGIPVPLTRALLVLDEATPMRDIADQLGCDPSYVTGLADQLEERGFITRTTGEDRRVKLLQLTDEGRVTRARIAEAVQADALFGRQLDASQKQTLRELLELMSEG